jgi:hypothetical protein
MSDWKKSFPSKYVQVADLDTPMVVTITHVSEENVGTEGAVQVKPVVYFRETRKGVVLNKTRGEAIQEIAGSSDMDDWVNVRIQIQRGETLYQGKRVPCIDVVAPTPRTASRTKPPTPPPTTDDEGAF